MSVNRRRVRAIFRKELREYRRNRSLVVTMAIFPSTMPIGQPPLRGTEIGREVRGGTSVE